MADDPSSIPEEPQDHVHPDCPFCSIASTFQPISPTHLTNSNWDPERLSPPAFVLFSSDHVVAFLDIAPLTRGHVLVAPRRHRIKVGNLTESEAAEIGRILPLLTRCVLKAALPDIPHDEVDYNVVQNNGPGAAQVIPHVHFHIIPRPPLDYKPIELMALPTRVGTMANYARSKIPTGFAASSIQFGRGMRHELDEDEAAILVGHIRNNIKNELERSQGQQQQSQQPQQPQQPQLQQSEQIEQTQRRQHQHQDLHSSAQMQSKL